MARGRRELDVAEKLRRWIWYESVKRLSGLTNYEMDIWFDLDRDLKPNNRSKDKRRIIIFHALETKAWMPFRGRHEEFVRYVEQVEIGGKALVAGTASIFLSPFWRLMNGHDMKLDELRQFIVDCMHGLGMFEEEKVSRQEAGDTISRYVRNIRNEESKQGDFHFSLYKEALEDVIHKVPDNLDKLAYLGGLLREAYFAGRLEYCLLLNQAYGRTLDNVAASEWIPEKFRDEFWVMASQRVLGSFFQKRGENQKSYFALLKDPRYLDALGGTLLIQHDLVFWTRGGIMNVMKSRL